VGCPQLLAGSFRGQAAKASGWKQGVDRAGDSDILQDEDSDKAGFFVSSSSFTIALMVFLYAVRLNFY